MRRGAARILGRLKPAAAFPPLLAALGDPDAETRREAVIGLGRLGDARGAPGLVGRLDDAEASVRKEDTECGCREHRVW